MKTTITTLLGAATVLLATLTTTHAAGKGKGGNGGGGDGGSTPEGTIYYYGNHPGWGGATPTISMSPDGSNKTVVGGDGWGTIFGTPSLNQHNNHRVFLRWLLIPDPDHIPTPEEPVKYLEHPDGSFRSELIVLRGDYNPDTNNTPQTICQLTDDPTLQQLGGRHWLLGDDFISFVARRWSSTGPGATVVGGGIYVLPVEFDADGNVTGLGEMPTTPTIPLPLVPDDTSHPDAAGLLRPDVVYYSWAPGGNMFVYTKGSDPYGVWVADVVTGGETRISEEPAHAPQWSTSGDWIVYGVGGGFVKVKPNGKRKSWILQKTSTWEFYNAQWSPDSGQLVFTGQAREENGLNNDIFRMNADGSGLVNLTNTPAPTRELTHGGNAGWR